MSDLNKSTEASSEISDPFTLHHSDQPGNVLVSKVLVGDNYGAWSRAMRISLNAKNKLGLVDGTIKAPSETDKTYASWQRCNDMVLAWILNSVHGDIVNSVSYYTTAAEVWADLRDRYSQGNDARIFQLKCEIVELRQGQQSISVYYTKMKALWDELSSYNDATTCTCGGLKKICERGEKDKVMQFLMGLNDTYSAVRGQILLMQPLPDTRKTHSLVLQQEKQMEVSLNHTNTNSYAMNVIHRKELASKSLQSQKEKVPLHCSHCDQDYHTIDKCYYLHGFPPGHKFHGKNVKPPNKRRSAANHAKADVENSKSPITSQNDGPTFTREEYNQIMAMLKRNNGNPQHLANVTGCTYEEDDWPGQAI